MKPARTRPTCAKNLILPLLIGAAAGVLLTLGALWVQSFFGNQLDKTGKAFEDAIEKCAKTMASKRKHKEQFEELEFENGPEVNKLVYGYGAQLDKVAEAWLKVEKAENAKNKDKDQIQTAMTEFTKEAREAMKPLRVAYTERIAKKKNTDDEEESE